MNEIIFVTQNKNKLDTAQKLINNFNINNINFDVPEIQSLDPKEIIKYKLEYAYKKLEEPCFVIDDSLFIDALNGFPGPFIKWFYDKTVGAEKTCQIVNLFKEYGCKWVSILGYYDGKETIYIEETIEGNISREPKGFNGFSWDPIFIPLGETKTFAQMTFEQKHEFAPTTKIYAEFRKILEKTAAI